MDEIAEQSAGPDAKLSPAEKLKAAENVCAELKSALRAAGVTLPSLWVEPTGYADGQLSPLIQLGRCNLETARALLALLGTVQEDTAPTTA